LKRITEDIDIEILLAEQGHGGVKH